MHKRRHLRLIQPHLQVRLILTFMGVACLALILQYVLFLQVASEAALRLPNDGLLLLEVMDGRLFVALLVSFGLLLPCTVIVGILATHRFAGPLYRFQQYLGQIVAGEKVGECRLRQGDELQALCDLLNTVTAPLRAARDDADAAEAAAKAAAEVAGEAGRRAA